MFLHNIWSYLKVAEHKSFSFDKIKIVKKQQGQFKIHCVKSTSVLNKKEKNYY
jgi:hypothetical protein